MKTQYNNEYLRSINTRISYCNIVNGINWVQCKETMLLKSVDIRNVQNTDQETWKCSVCDTVNIINDSIEDVTAGKYTVSQLEIKFIIEENELLKKLLK